MRSMKIMKWMLDKYGYTDGCEGCRLKRSGVTDQRPHTKSCRERTEQALDGDEKGRRVKEAVSTRFTEWMAEKLEKEDKAKADETAKKADEE